MLMTAEDSQTAVPLSTVPAGRTVRLVSIEAGQGLRGRLAALGLVPGASLRVVNNSAFGPFVVAVKGSRIVLGRGMAGKVTVA